MRPHDDCGHPGVFAPDFFASASVTRLSNPALCITTDSDHFHRQYSRHGCKPIDDGGLTENGEHRGVRGTLLEWIVCKKLEFYLDDSCLMQVLFTNET